MFFRYLVHIVNDALPVPLYEPETHHVSVVDTRGREISVPVRRFAAMARSARKFSVLEIELRACQMLRTHRLGNTRLTVVKIRDTVNVTKRLAGRGEYFYDASALSMDPD